MNEDPLQLSLFYERNLAEIIHPDSPGERLIACRNPFLATDRARTREELLAVTERNLEKVRRRVHRKRRPLRGETEIGVEVGKMLGASHFCSSITRPERRRCAAPAS